MTWANKPDIDRANAYRKLAGEIDQRLRSLRKAGTAGQTELVNLGNAIRCLKSAGSEIYGVEATMQEIWEEMKGADVDVEKMMGEP